MRAPLVLAAVLGCACGDGADLVTADAGPAALVAGCEVPPPPPDAGPCVCPVGNVETVILPVCGLLCEPTAAPDAGPEGGAVLCGNERGLLDRCPP